MASRKPDLAGAFSRRMARIDGELSILKLRL